jgi:hypothetical protein
MKRLLSILAVLFTVCIAVLPFAGCTPGQQVQTTQSNTGSNVQRPAGSMGYTTGAGTGHIEIHMTDAPPQKKEITSVMLTVSSIEIHSTGSGQDNQGTRPVSDNTTKPQNQPGGDTWTRINITGSSTFDLLKIKGLDELFAAGDVPAGKYTQVRLVVASATVGFSDNSTVTATVPSGELKFVNSFDVVEGKTTVLTFDFDAEKSINVTGQDKVMIKPVVKLDVKQK